jgi:hypothetical protein
MLILSEPASPAISVGLLRTVASRHDRLCNPLRLRSDYPTSAVEDFTGRWGIVKDVPANVSDHYLVWAEFYTDRDSD